MDLGKDDGWLQERYARCLDACAKMAFALSVVAFLAYVSGLLPAYVPLERLPELWQLPLPRYLEATGAATGWDWLRLVRYGDYANNLGIALFALIVLFCDLAILPPLIERGERLLAGLAIAQVAVLLAAASGTLAGG